MQVPSRLRLCLIKSVGESFYANAIKKTFDKPALTIEQQSDISCVLLIMIDETGNFNMDSHSSPSLCNKSYLLDI